MHHSTDTALLDVTNCLLGNADEGRMPILTLFDLSAAFDALDHSILLARLHDIFDISGKSFEWFSSYFSDRFSSFSVNGRVSSQIKLHHGVLRGLFWALFYRRLFWHAFLSSILLFTMIAWGISVN